METYTKIEAMELIKGVFISLRDAKQAIFRAQKACFYVAYKEHDLGPLNALFDALKGSQLVQAQRFLKFTMQEVGKANVLGKDGVLEYTRADGFTRNGKRKIGMEGIAKAMSMPFWEYGAPEKLGFVTLSAVYSMVNKARNAKDKQKGEKGSLDTLDRVNARRMAYLEAIAKVNEEYADAFERKEEPTAKAV